MTAEIAILNTHGVAIAADSAITLRFSENEQKIYNSANKVFALSKYHPVGIMIYNNATFMGIIDWEILIKEYRKNIGEYRKNIGDNTYRTLFEYASNFIKFISNYKFIKKEHEENFLLSFCYGFFSYFKETFFSNLEKNWEILTKFLISK